MLSSHARARQDAAEEASGSSQVSRAVLSVALSAQLTSNSWGHLLCLASPASAGSELGRPGGSPSGSVPFLSGRCPVLPKVQCLKVIVAYVFTYILVFFMGKGRSGLFLHLGHKWTLISDVPFVANILPLHSQPFQCRLPLCPSRSCLSSDRPYASLPVPGACRFLPRKLLSPDLARRCPRPRVSAGPSPCYLPPIGHGIEPFLPTASSETPFSVPKCACRASAGLPCWARVCVHMCVHTRLALGTALPPVYCTRLCGDMMHRAGVEQVQLRYICLLK